jgi:ribonucleotide reductase alpha subunit
MGLMTGAGIGTDYSEIRSEGKLIRKTGGFATGPIALGQIVNETGRGIMQGGSRRSALWAGLRWDHADIMKFIVLKNWIKEVRDLKAKDFNFPATMDMTNISVLLNDEFFAAYVDEKNPKHTHAHLVYWTVVERSLKTGEPGFSIDTGKNSKETLRNAPVSADTYVLTVDGYQPVRDIIGEPTTVWTGHNWAPDVVFTQTGWNTPVVKVNLTGGRSIVCDPMHEFVLSNGDRVHAKNLSKGYSLFVSMNSTPLPHGGGQEGYALGYIYGDGSFHKKYPRAEATFCTEESKKCSQGFPKELLTSINPCDGRGFIRLYTRNNALFSNRDKSVFPHDVFSWKTNKQVQFLAGLFDADGNYFEEQNRVRVSSKHKPFLVGVRRLLEQIGILSGISTAGISTYGKSQGYSLTVQTEYVNRFANMVPTLRLNIKQCSSYRKAQIKVVSVQDEGLEDVFCCDVNLPEHSFMAEGVIVSNCTEVTSCDDSDVCNLGSVNLARVETLEELKGVVECASAFLLAGTVYSDVPYSKVDTIRTKNRRLGLGLMGIHEWLLKRGKKYGSDKDLDTFLEVYATSGSLVKPWVNKWDLTKPVKTRAIAPTGTIGIVGETTTGGEPIFCAAYKRRYLKGGIWNFQYVVDPTAKRLIEGGVNPDDIEDAYVLSEDIERRLAFQAHLQTYVDHGISSTINLPQWGSESNNADTVRKIGNIIIKYLPQLRGLTTYPDGARSGQPLNPVRYQTAVKHIGEVFVEAADICEISGKGGSCGS